MDDKPQRLLYQPLLRSNHLGKLLHHGYSSIVGKPSGQSWLYWGTSNQEALRRRHIILTEHCQKNMIAMKKSLLSFGQFFEAFLQLIRFTLLFLVLCIHPNYPKLLPHFVGLKGVVPYEELLRKLALTWQLQEHIARHERQSPENFRNSPFFT